MKKLAAVLLVTLFAAPLLRAEQAEWAQVPDILLRITPGIDPHTHKFITTGVIDSKFGFLLSSAEKAVSQAISIFPLAWNRI